MMVMAFQSSPIFSLPRARLECSEIIFRFMRSLVLAYFLLSWTGPARSDRSRPGRGIPESLGTAPFWENSETSSQNIPLKGRADSRDPAEFWPQRLFAFELRRGDTQLGPMLGSQQGEHCPPAPPKSIKRQATAGVTWRRFVPGRWLPDRFCRPRSDPCDDRN